MTPQEMWNAYKQINPSIGDEIDAWAFGVEADLLADLVLKGEKTATASAYDLYAVDNDPLPQEGTFDVVLDSQDQAVCIVEVTKVSVQPFHQVSADHAYKEGEGDKSLAYWRQVHEVVFTEWMSEAGLTFTPDSKVVLEEFRKVYTEAQEQYDRRAKQKGRKSCLKLMNTPRNMILSEIFSISFQGLQFSRKLSYIFNTWLFYKGDKLMRLDLKIDGDLAFEQALFEIPYHKKIAT